MLITHSDCIIFIKLYLEVEWLEQPIGPVQEVPELNYSEFASVNGTGPVYFFRSCFYTIVFRMSHLTENWIGYMHHHFFFDKIQSSLNILCTHIREICFSFFPLGWTYSFIKQFYSLLGTELETWSPCATQTYVGMSTIPCLTNGKLGRKLCLPSWALQRSDDFSW